jgi:hypothetical protein
MDCSQEKLRLEQKLNQELDSEIYLWTYGDKEDLEVYMLTDKIRNNKLKYLRQKKKESDCRLKEHLLSQDVV